MESDMGLKLSLPENAIAVTMVGDARKFIVCRLPSFLALKFLAYTECQSHNTKNADL